MLGANRVTVAPVGLTTVAGVVGIQLRGRTHRPSLSRVDIAGDWLVLTHEDQPNYAPGPELGDYTGLPINAAARQKAEWWAATVLSQSERQAASTSDELLVLRYCRGTRCGDITACTDGLASPSVIGVELRSSMRVECRVRQKEQ